MKCEEIIQKFLNQDDSRYPSLFVRLHTLICSDCREEMRIMQNIFVKARLSSSFVTEKDISDLLMKRISGSEVMYAKNISSSKWFFTGAVIFASIILVSYSDSFIWLKEYFGSGLEIPLNIVLGLIITSYAASYIGTHLEELKKLVEIINHKIH